VNHRRIEEEVACSYVEEEVGKDTCETTRQRLRKIVSEA
jgi:hypothetical protein